MIRDEFRRIYFDPFLTHFWSQNGFFSGHFGIFHGPNCVTTGSKWARNTCLGTRNGLKSLFEALLTLFWSKNSHFQRILGFSMAQNASPRAQNGLEKRVATSPMVEDLFRKCAFLTHFWSQHGPFSRQFGIFQGVKRIPTGSKWAKNTCLSLPNGPGSFLEKRVSDPFLTHFWSQNSPFSRHVGIFHGPKRGPTGSKWAKNTCLSLPSDPG